MQNFTSSKNMDILSTKNVFGQNLRESETIQKLPWKNNLTATFNLNFCIILYFQHEYHTKITPITKNYYFEF
jgi:hypothetical protein